jgi:DNA-binding winged helix-turn-helix (wHTH) protein
MIYRFGEYELDMDLFSLRRGGVPIGLRPKVFRVLTYLLEHRHRVVTRQELFEHMWPKQFVSDAALESCIKVVRQLYQLARGRRSPDDSVWCASGAGGSRPSGGAGHSPKTIAPP